jgi:hypothetical protein
MSLIVLDCGRDLHQGEFKSILKIALDCL